MAEPLGQQAASEPEVFLLYEGGDIAKELRSKLTHVRVGPQVKKIPNSVFRGCKELVKIQLDKGLQVIGPHAFRDCTALRSVIVPSTVTKLGLCAFSRCHSLTHAQLFEGLKCIKEGAFEGCTALRSVTLPSTVTKLGMGSFYHCSSLIELRWNEGLKVIGESAFKCCTALRSVTIPSTVTKLGRAAFYLCENLIKVQLNEGLKIIGACAFEQCIALRSVTIPSSVTKMSYRAFGDCSNLSELILLGGERLLDQEFLNRGIFSEEQGLLNQRALDEILFDDGYIEDFVFHGSPVTTVKISTSWAVSERMSRLPLNCRLSVEERFHNVRRLEMLQHGNVLACFPILRREDCSDDEDKYVVQDTNLETARSLYRVLQLIAFHELKESSIQLELAVWKSRIDGAMPVPRADCRVAIPDPAKSSIMEYCGFAGFLKPAIEGT